MEKYKICPSCGAQNSPISIECASCESDLTGVKLSDEENEKTSGKEPRGTPKGESASVRICDCGAKNPPNTRKCTSCGEDISDISPTKDTNEIKKFMLSSIDGKYAFEINEASVIIGREQNMREYLQKKPFVSRTHAKIMIDGDALIIENLSGTNYTYVNNKKMGLGERVTLIDGDELGLGGFVKNGERQNDAAYFLVRGGLCT